MKLSILIPSLQSRAHLLANLKADLFRQIIACKAEDEVEILTEVDNGEATIGSKRNALLDKANGAYLCFHDDDDTPASTYIERILACIRTGCDNCSMTGVITIDGNNPELFEHSLKYSEWRTNETGPIKYERMPNHLSVIRSDIAKKFRFPEIDHGEDREWSETIYKSGLLKKETTIPGVLYHYQYVSKK